NPRTPWKADIKMDDQNRFKSIENDNFKREYTYFDGTDKIKSYTVVEKKTGRSATWTRGSADSDSWTATNQQPGQQIDTVKGECAISGDGIHVVRNNGGENGPEAGTYAFTGDGIKTGLTASADRTVVAGDGTPHYVRRPDGSTIAYTNADKTQISVYDADS